MSESEENVAVQLQQEEVIAPHQDEGHPISESSASEERSNKEINFEKLREAKQQLESENRELKAWVESQKASSRSKEEDNDLSLDDDDIVEGKVVKKLYKKLKSLENAYEREKAEGVPDRLKSKFSDFDTVVTKENVEKLQRTEPELYRMLMSGNDLYSKGVSAYKTLTALGIADNKRYTEEKERAQANSSRPRSSQAIKGQGALSDANMFAKGLTPELKKQLQMEMEDAAKAR